MTMKIKVYKPSRQNKEATILLMKANEFNELMYLVIEDGPNQC